MHFDRAEGGSFSLMIAGVLAAAVERGWDADVVLFEAPHRREWVESLADTGARVHVAPIEYARHRRRQTDWLVRELGPAGPTVLHSHFTTWDIAARAAAPRLGDPSAVFWHVHSALSKQPWIVGRTALKFGILGRRVDGFLCPAPNLVEGVRRRGAPNDRVFFIPSALSTSRFPLLTTTQRLAAREDVGLPEDAWVLLHFGWHPYLKGTDRFLEALAELPEHRGRPVHGLIRGGGEETADLAADLGVADRAHAQGPVDEIATLFGASNALVAGSREEGMAYSVLESICSGTPVVATDIPGHAVIADQIAAVKTVEHSPKALAAGVREILDRPDDEAQREAERGREWVVENLGIEFVANRMLDMYSEALDTDRGRPRRSPEWLGDVTKAPVAGISAPAATSGRIRLLHLAGYYGQNRGSFIPMLEESVRRALLRGWDAEIVLPGDLGNHPWIGDLEAAGAIVTRAPLAGRIATGRWLVQHLSDGRFAATIMHTHFTIFDVPAVLAKRELRETRVIWHFHSSLGSSLARIPRDAVKFSVFGGLPERILGVSEGICRSIRRRSGRRAEFFPNAIDLGAFFPASAEFVTEARSKFGLPKNGPVALALARDWHLKGGDRLVGALAGMPPERRPHALIVTEDPAAVEAVRSAGLEQNVTLTPPVADARELYGASDVFVAPSRAEGMPLAVLEAAAMGLPVVASDLDGHRHIADRVPGVQVVPMETKALAGAVTEALESRCDEAAAASRAAVRDNFALPVWADRLDRTYDAVLSEAPVRG